MYFIKLNDKGNSFSMKLKSVLTIGLTILLIVSSRVNVNAQQELKTKVYNPILGWSSWSFIRRNPTAAKIKTQALALHKSSLQEIGYQYINLDDFWYVCSNHGPEVDAYGRWITDTKRFPAKGKTNGIKVVADYIHGLGLKFGIYITPGISKQAVKKNTPIKGTAFTAGQIAEPSVTELNYNCKGMVGINFNKPGAQEYINSWTDMFSKWGGRFH